MDTLSDTSVQLLCDELTRSFLRKVAMFGGQCDPRTINDDGMLPYAGRVAGSIAQQAGLTTGSSSAGGDWVRLTEAGWLSVRDSRPVRVLSDIAARGGVREADLVRMYLRVPGAGSALHELLSEGLLDRANGELRPTPRGLALHGAVASHQFDSPSDKSVG